jgi:hypothetical protein
MKRLLLLLLTLSVCCLGQTPITVTGTIVDTSNNVATSGYVQFDLTPQNQALTYQIPPSTVIASSSKCGINSLGHPVQFIDGVSACLVWPNDLILPANTLYSVTIAPNNIVSRVYNNALFVSSTNPQSLATLIFIQPQPVIGTIINASPLITESVVPSNDLAWSVGQPNLRYTNIWVNRINGLPPGSAGSAAGVTGNIQTNVGGLLGAIPNAPNGSNVVSNSAGNGFTTQVKAIYDSRDWMTCDGTTDATSGMASLLSTIGSNQATIVFPTSLPCVLGTLVFPTNITLDFGAAGSFKGIVNNTAPGGAAFVSGNSTELNFPTVINSCSVTITTTGTPSVPTIIAFMAVPYPGFTFNYNNPTDTGGHVYIPVQQSLLNQPRNSDAWTAAGITTSGSLTITATTTGTLTHAQCFAHEYSGFGPGVTTDGNGASNNAVGNPMNSGSGTVSAGSLLIGYGGDVFTPQTCTAGTGYTQPAGAAGQSTTGQMCVEYKLSAAGGSTLATQNVTNAGASWVYSMLALKPGSSNLFIQGGINNPNGHQIFYNCLGGLQCTVDFTNNVAGFVVPPEWWGASPSVSATINTPALQAAEHAAFGTNRTNASGQSKWNKTLYLNGNYTINDELQFYHVFNFKVICNGRLNAGITQSGTNKRFIDGQSIAYGAFYDCSWTNSGSSTKPQIDLDYDSVTTPGDLRPQFIDFHHNTFIGNGITDVGVLIAKSGGTAQGSNIYCYDCAAQGFTGAAWQAGGNGTGRNVGRSYALNALAIGWYGGDIQGSPLYGWAGYGSGYIFFFGTTFENGFIAQTGFDVYNEAGQGPCTLNFVRSESRRLVSCSSLDVRNSGTGDGQMQYPVPGASAPVGTIMGGDITGIGWDGRYYKVTIDTNSFNGVGTPSAQIIASSGTATTISDTNQTVAGSNTIKTFVSGEGVTQSVTGSTGTLVGAVPSSNGTITGSVTSLTIVAGDIMTQAVTGVTCISQNSPTGTQSLICNNFSGTANSSNIWTDGGTGGTYTPTAAPTFSATTMLITAATGAPDNSHPWTGGTSGAVLVPTTAPVNHANYTVNGFNGMLMTLLTGTGKGCYGVITSNTATAITFSAGLVTRFYQLNCPNPDSTSTYVVQPNWNNGTVVDDNNSGCGGSCMTMVSLNEDGIAGGLAGQNAQGVLENVSVPGDMIKMAPNANTVLNNVQVTRSDWLDTAGGFSQLPQSNHDWDVYNVNSAGVVGLTYYQNWSYPFNGGGQRTYVGPFHRDLGTRVLTWSCSGTSGPACLDTWIGGRSDTGATTDPSRNILEFGGILGRASPFGTNLNGTATQFQGGLPTGSGTPGNIEFWEAPGGGGSSATPQSGALVASVTPAGFSGPIALKSFPFGSLPSSPVNGTLVYCSDCKNVTDDTTGTFDSAAANGGHGTNVLRENGAWRVH